VLSSPEASLKRSLRSASAIKIARRTSLLFAWPGLLALMNHPSLQELMRQIRHHTISDQVGEINAFLRGHYAYYGVAGNLRCLVKVYRAVERYWHRMLRSRSWAGRALNWSMFNQINERTPLLKPKLRLPYTELQALAVL
jgi:RNA-directed DNA polymerase